MNEVLSLEAQKQNQEVVAYLESVKSITVSTPTEAARAAEVCLQLAKHKKTVERVYREHKDPVYQKGKQIDNAFKSILDPINNMVRRLDVAIHDFKMAAERKRREEQAKLEAAAAAERAKLMEKVFAAQQKADEEREAGNDAAAEKIEAKAAVAEQKAANVVAPVAVSSAPDTRGLSTKEVWKVVVDSQETLVRWLIETGKTGMLLPDLSQLNKWVDKNRSDSASMKGAHTERAIRGAHRINTIM